LTLAGEWSVDGGRVSCRSRARSPFWAALGGGGAAGGCGRGDVGMAGAAASESVTISGRPERVAVARRSRRRCSGGSTRRVRRRCSWSAGWLPTASGTVLPGCPAGRSQSPSSAAARSPGCRSLTGAVPPCRRCGLEAPARRAAAGDCTSWTPWPPAGGSSRTAVTPQPGSSFSTADAGTAQHRGQVCVWITRT
jgi:hypothetical protein